MAVLGGSLTLAQSGGVIAPGDVLYIEVYRVPEMTQTYLVRQDGTIAVPYISSVSVAGLKEPAAEANIAAALTKILRNPRVTVTKSDVDLMSPAAGRTSEMVLEIIPLLNSHAETLSTMLQGMNSPGGHISYDPDTNSLLITDTPGAIKNVMSVIARLDQMKSQMTQVRIEVKIVEVRVGALKELGIRWFVQGNHLGGGFNPSPDRTNSINNLGGGFGPLGNELISSNSSSGNNPLGNSFGREFIGPFDRRLSIPVVVPLPGQAFLGYSNAGLDIGTLIDALVSNEKARILANPTILTVNHKKAVLKMVDEFPYTEFGTEITGATRFSVQFLEMDIDPGSHAARRPR
ncbi:MAG: polysaccharide biosynthesis/export family protein [Candidatus Hydrogenedentes bacterium]|nr:polysaccharide biosynthesis/export family protein [Candidatus Hydrogenedentota bacterium]